MAPEDAEAWAISKAREIVLREGAELAMAARSLAESEIEAESTLLAVAITKALLEAYQAGLAATR